MNCAINLTAQFIFSTAFCWLKADSQNELAANLSHSSSIPSVLQLRKAAHPEYCPWTTAGRSTVPSRRERPHLQRDRCIPGLGKSKSTNDPIKVFRREYKKRFAWIKAGRITKDEFFVWSEKAREKQDECDEQKITLEEFETWLKNS